MIAASVDRALASGTFHRPGPYPNPIKGQADHKMFATWTWSSVEWSPLSSSTLLAAQETLLDLANTPASCRLARHLVTGKKCWAAENVVRDGHYVYLALRPCKQCWRTNLTQLVRQVGRGSSWSVFEDPVEGRMVLCGCQRYAAL